MTIPVRPRLQWAPVPRAGEQAAERAEPRMRRLGQRIEANAKRRVPVRTGALKRSIGHSVSRRGPVVRLLVFARARHARFIEEGTRPHVIRPRNARALRFEIGGRVVFAQRVNHPGTAARPFLRDAVREELARNRLI
ncbi:HK97 gp10 family phage protein [Nocardia wallacei]|uniref:HK97 gp10 family phage protein n=1 Tax=Nocardia wallacei TaxID=480035 RepID=UPI00245422A7|nr:HK97 gp10 family phage protein [Nocardia wallacei]